jgi:hypothetical protein
MASYLRHWLRPRRTADHYYTHNDKHCDPVTRSEVDDQAFQQPAEATRLTYHIRTPCQIVFPAPQNRSPKTSNTTEQTGTNWIYHTPNQTTQQSNAWPNRRSHLRPRSTSAPRTFGRLVEQYGPTHHHAKPPHTPGVSHPNNPHKPPPTKAQSQSQNRSFTTATGLSGRRGWRSRRLALPG